MRYRKMKKFMKFMFMMKMLKPKMIPTSTKRNRKSSLFSFCPPAPQNSGFPGMMRRSLMGHALVDHQWDLDLEDHQWDVDL